MRNVLSAVSKSRWFFIVAGFVAPLLGASQVFAQSIDERHIDCTTVYNPLIYPVCALREISTLTEVVLTWAMFLGGLVALFMFIYGGYLRATARDDAQQAEQGISAMTWAVIAAMLAASLFIFLRLLGSFINVDVFSGVPVAYAQEDAVQQEQVQMEDLVQISGEIRSYQTGEVIPGTQVTLFWFSSDGWVEWPAQTYLNQRNPYTADTFGQYRFLVPPGSYRLLANRNGYLEEESEVIAVELDKPIVRNITLQEGRLIWAYLVAAGWIVFIVAAAYIIVVRIVVWRKKSSLRSHLLSEIRKEDENSDTTLESNTDEEPS